MREILQCDKDVEYSNKHEHEETTKEVVTSKEVKTAGRQQVKHENIKTRETIKRRKDLIKLTTPLNVPIYNCSDLTPAKAKPLNGHKC